MLTEAEDGTVHAPMEKSINNHILLPSSRRPSEGAISQSAGKELAGFKGILGYLLGLGRDRGRDHGHGQVRRRRFEYLPFLALRNECAVSGRLRTLTSRRNPCSRRSLL